MRAVTRRVDSERVQVLLWALRENWALPILTTLEEGPCRFADLQFDEVSSKVLGETLRSLVDRRLVRHDLVQRAGYPDVWHGALATGGVNLAPRSSRKTTVRKGTGRSSRASASP